MSILPGSRFLGTRDTYLNGIVECQPVGNLAGFDHVGFGGVKGAVRPVQVDGQALAHA